MCARACVLFIAVLIAFRAALEGKPSEIDLDKVSKNAGDEWRSLLTHLGVPLVKCKTLYEESRGNPVSACFAGLAYWREGNELCKPATWSVLLEALEKGAEKREYARELREEIVGRGKSAKYVQPRTARPLVLVDSTNVYHNPQAVCRTAICPMHL